MVFLLKCQIRIIAWVKQIPEKCSRKYFQRSVFYKIKADYLILFTTQRMQLIRRYLKQTFVRYSTEVRYYTERLLTADLYAI